MNPPRLFRAPDGSLRLDSPDGPVPVRIARCFPWAEPGRYLSLRDEKGTERAFVGDPEELDPESATLLHAELRETGQTFEITAILECRKEIELRCWEVETRQGRRRFQTELDEWPLRLPGGRILLQDLAGDLYTLDDPASLDPRSSSLLWPLLD